MPTAAKVVAGLFLAVGVSASIGCGSARPCRPVPPSVPIVVEDDAPSVYDAGLGNGSVAFWVASPFDSTKLPNRRVHVGCGDVEIVLATDSAGHARLRGLPAAHCEASVIGPLGRERARSWEQPRDGRMVVGLRARTTSLAPERLPADVLPADVVLQRESSGCLGRCRRFTLELHRDGRVELERDFHRRNVDGVRFRRWRLAPVTTRRALAQARCLAAGPSYDQDIYDTVTRTVEVRDGDAIGVYLHDAHHPQLPAENARRLRRLDRVLRLPPGAWSPRARVQPPKQMSRPPSQ